MNFVLLPLQIENRHARDFLGDPEQPKVFIDSMGQKRPLAGLLQTVMRPAMERATVGRIANRADKRAVVGNAAKAVGLGWCFVVSIFLGHHAASIDFEFRTRIISATISGFALRSTTVAFGFVAGFSR